MKIERHETGQRMSKAVIHGETVYLAGIVADSPKGKGMAEQTRSILSQIDNFLAMAGTNKTKLLSANIWITDMAHFGEMNTVWDAWVSPGNTPARATVEAKLASPDYKVEIMVVAARGRYRSMQQTRKPKPPRRSRMTAGSSMRNRRSVDCQNSDLNY